MHNICLYIAKNTQCINAVYSVTIEDLTDNKSVNSEFLNYLQYKLFNHHNYIEYNNMHNGYDVLEANQATNSAVCLGVKRFKTFFEFNSKNAINYPIRLKLSSPITRAYYTNYKTTFIPNLQLEPMQKYILTMQYISGDCTVNDEFYFPSMVVYDFSTSYNNFGEFKRITDKLCTLEFIAPENPVILCVYFVDKAFATNLLVDITLQKISNTSSDGTSSSIEVLPESYFMNEINDTITKVRNLITEPALTFFWATDIHRYSSNAYKQTFDNMITNMKYISKKIDCDFILNTGDITDGNIDKILTVNRAQQCMEDFQSIGVPYLFAQGNHDNNPYANSEDLFNIQDCFKRDFV